MNAGGFDGLFSCCHMKHKINMDETCYKYVKQVKCIPGNIP